MNSEFGLKTLSFKEVFKNKIRLLMAVLLFSMAVLGLVAVRPADAAATTGQLSVNNPTVGLGDHVSLNGSGFMPNEQVAVWLTAPNGSAFSYGRVYAYDGTFSNYTNTWADDALIYPGTWHVTAQGLDSGTQAYATFTMVRPTLRASASMMGDGTSQITIDAYNWYRGERITLWVTDMSGNVAYVGYAWIYRDGSVIEGKSFNVALHSGSYHLSAYGNTSGVTVVTTFTVS